MKEKKRVILITVLVFLGLCLANYYYVHYDIQSDLLAGRTARRYIAQTYGREESSVEIALAGESSECLAGLISWKGAYSARYVTDPAAGRYVQLTIPGYFPFLVTQVGEGVLQHEG